ncbi:hypothetical protein GDO78_006548 [Eleutherodactylus coqui]|uniref:Secreted protein n=1 Tax=Eleutherodactylus coqui TaxID=57060 RepID=A0A8J6FNX5_ELECQ|nr:hypothetical protein GDO78_006548 [Eleutherodactylus coqui]
MKVIFFFLKWFSYYLKYFLVVADQDMGLDNGKTPLKCFSRTSDRSSVFDRRVSDVPMSKMKGQVIWHQSKATMTAGIRSKIERH